MVTSLCGAECGATGQPVASYKDYCAPVAFRKYGNPFFALIGCDVSVADITDPAAIAALVASGDIALGPIGKLDLPSPTATTSEDVNICAGATVISTTYVLNFTSYQTAGDDCEYWNTFLKNHASYRIVWFNCDGEIYASGEYIDYMRDTSGTPDAVTGNPGFQFTVTSPPHEVEGDGKKVRWETSLSIELDGSEIIRRAFIPGLFDAFKPVAAV